MVQLLEERKNDRSKGGLGAKFEPIFSQIEKCFHTDYSGTEDNFRAFRTTLHTVLRGAVSKVLARVTSSNCLNKEI